jgi:hypothetical protein
MLFEQNLKALGVHDFGFCILINDFYGNSSGESNVIDMLIIFYAHRGERRSVPPQKTLKNWFIKCNKT